MGYNVGDKVARKRGNGEAEGEVVSTTSESVTITTQGNEVTRHGSKNDKAITIKQDDGTKVLKLESELE